MKPAHTASRGILHLPSGVMAILTVSLLSLPLQGQTNTITGADGGNNSWNTASNWSAGVPTGTIDAAVGPGVVAKVDSASTPAYDGSLLLDTNAQLQVGWTTNNAANTNVLGTGTITMRQGSVIISRAGLGTYSFTQPFILDGDATIWAGISTSNHNTTKTFNGGVSGLGTLTYNGVNNTTLVFNTASPSWSGGLQTADPQSQNHQLKAAVNGALGTGNVTINARCSIEILPGLGDAIGDGAALSFNGVKSSNMAAKLVLGSDEVVRSLSIDGIQQNAGFYDTSSGLLDAGGNPLISGSGTLIVLDSPGTESQMAIVGTDPANGAPDARATDMPAVFLSKPPVALTGNITLRNLTDSVDTQIPVGGPDVTISGYTLTIDPGSALQWGKNYAIRIDAGAIESDTGIPFAGIGDDLTWAFTTLPGDPLLTAVQDLKNHITGASTLTGTEIAARKATLDAERDRFDESTANISAVLDLVTTYDIEVGPLWVDGSPVQGFDRRTASDQDINWVVFNVMQSIMDEVYNPQTLADPAKRALLVGYKFGSSADFPGPCDPPADPGNVHSATINGSFPVTFGRETQQWTLPARKPTGTYLAPGTIATVSVPPGLVNAGYQVRVGAHSWDHEERGRPPVPRLSRATLVYPLDAASIEIASPYGGGIYIEVPYGALAGVVDVDITGAVRSPYFSAKSFHQTTPAEWDIERSHPAPWADFQSDKFMMQVPRTWIYNHPDPTQLMADWDAAMDAINDLMGFPRIRGKETMYVQVDLIMRSSVHAPGYPAVNVTGNPNTDTYGGYRNNYFTRGPGASPTAAHIEFHEQGHAYFFPKFGGETESNVNLLQPAMLHRKFGYDLDTAHRASLGSGNVNRTLDNTAVAWMCVFNFSPREVPMATGEKAYQHKGHAKFLDIVRLYGWDGLDTFWRSFMEDDANNIPYGSGTDDLLLRLCKSVGKDIRPLFHFWGIHPQNPQALAAAIAAENIPADPAIRDLLQHYKTLVPADNAAFRTFALAWWGKKPSIGGFWEEREHSRQWDQEALFGAGDQQRADITINEEYIPASADQIKARIDGLVALYFPSAITPNPMSFAIAPTAVNDTTIGMTATTATSGSGQVEYYFENNTTNSGWITSTTWTDTGLTPGLTYDYRVKARDALLNETDWSATASATAEADTTPPSPSPMTFASPPTAVDESSITMTATAASDVNGVEYYFQCTSGNGNDSGWQDSPTYTDTGLSPVTEYTYVVRARDKSAGQNTTLDSAPASANTADIPDTVEPEILTLSPTGPVTDVATNLVATFTEPVVAGSGFITLKNLTDATQLQISINDVSQVSISGAVLTINPASDLLLNKTYAIHIDSGAVADVSNNPFTGITDDSTWRFNLILEDPLADAGGPYNVLIGGLLSLDGSASLPSEGATITHYDWDLNNDGTFGDVTGATPAAIDYTILTDDYGMIEGVNNIQLRVTDSAAKTSTVQTTVTLVQLYTYIGPNTTNADRWNVNTNWDSGVVPAGAVDVIISASNPYATVWSASTPAYTGNLTMAPGTTLQVGWTTDWPASYNAIGTSGSTTITMGAGALLKGRTSGNITVPAIVLQGDVTWSAGESTQAPASFTFANPITGAHKFKFQSNTASNPVFSAANTFDELEILTISGRGGSQGTARATAAGAFGAGDVSVTTTNGSIGYKLEFDVSGVMAAGATLNLDAKGPSGNGADRVQMDADNTIGFLILDGFPRPAGTYGRVGSPGAPTYEVSWMSGNSVLTVTNQPADTIVNVPAITDPVSGFTTDFYTGSSITYTLTFDEVVTTTATTADFENTGTATVTIDSVTQPAENVIQVVMTPTTTGTMNLGAAASASFDDLFGNTLNGPFTDDVTFNVLAGPPPNITITGTAGGGDSWNVGANWDSGFQPFSTYPATVANGVIAQVQNSATSAYSGGLTLQSGSSLYINNAVGSQTALGTGPITFEGATIRMTLNVSPVNFPALVLNGDATFTTGGNTEDNKTRNLTAGVSGTGNLKFVGRNNLNWNLQAASTFTGNMTFDAVDRYRVYFKTAGSAGTGDVTVNPRTSDNRSATLYFDANDAMADTGTLYLNGGGYGGAGTDRVIMNASDTIRALWIDGVQQAAGDYTSADSFISSGTGTLTVLTGPSTGSPFETWATGGELFGDDANGDGVSNGLAFLLGASGPNVDALGLLPTITETAGGLVMTFSMLDSASRGTATLSVEHSSDLGIGDAWTTVAVPEASGGPTSGVNFAVSPGSPTNDITATIGSTEAGGTGKLFGRLKATE